MGLYHLSNSFFQEGRIKFIIFSLNRLESIPNETEVANSILSFSSLVWTYIKNKNKNHYLHNNKKGVKLKEKKSNFLSYYYFLSGYFSEIIDKRSRA
jgi:hypothetical protein